MLSLIALVFIILGVLQPIAEAIQIDGRPFFFYGISTSNVSYGGINRRFGYCDEAGALAV